MADDIKNFDRPKRELIRRRQEVIQEIEGIKKELAHGEGKAPTEDLNRIFEQEVQRQMALKKDIEDAKKQLRDLRNQARGVAERRNQLIEDIREGSLRRREALNVLNSSTSTSDEKSAAKQQIEQIREEELVSRRDEAEQSSKLASFNTQISRQVGRVEQSSAEMSMSRRAARAVKSEISGREDLTDKLGKAQTKDNTLNMDLADYEERQKERARDEADRFNPQGLLNQVRRGQTPDGSIEALRAQKSLEKDGGTKEEQAAIKQATQEFYGLFGAMKDAKKSLAELTEGTEEHTRKQEELTNLQAKASETVAKIDKIEQQVEKRKLTGESGSTLSRAAQSGLGMAGDVARFGSSLMSGLGPQATERYVLEEQRKQAQLSLQNMALNDTRNRTTDATSFLSTGGGSLFGAEMPFNRRGQTNGAIQKLGQDYANTREAVPQYAVGLNALGGAFDVANNAIGEGVKMSGITGVSGVTAGAGSFLQGSAKLGMNTMADFMRTPELAGRFGGGAAAGAASGFMDNIAGGMGTGMKFAGGGAVEWGGGNRGQFEGGVDKVAGGGADLMKGLPNVMKRAYDSVEQMNQLISTEQQAGQAGRVRERLSMAFAPGMQQYMDAGQSMGQTLRSSSMSKSEREDYERRLEMSSMDGDLASRGFGVNEIIGATGTAAQSMGRFGNASAAARQGLIGESMGLGSAAMSIGAMGKMVSGGNDDPETLMKKAMKEGLMSGIQDSRQFQELLQAAQATSQGVGDFEGALKGVLTFAGSGRGNDMASAQAAALKAEDRMSGKTGGWHDMVKFDITNRAAKGAISAAEKSGIDLTREDRTSLQNLANMKPAELENEELVMSRLTSGAQKAIKASGKSVKEYGSNMANSMRVHSAMDGAINATQSPELAELRNMLAAGDKEGIRKKYANNPGRLKDLISLAGSGATADGTSMEAMGDQQAVINQAADALGVEPGTLGGVQRKFNKKDYDTAAAEGTAANTTFEQGGKGRADISQTNQALGTAASRQDDGQNRVAADLARTGDMYGQQQGDMIKNVKDMRTVDPTDKVARVDEALKQIADGLKDMKDSLKDFSAKDMVVNATKDIVIQGANSIKGVILDNGLTQAATEAGKAIADTVKNAMSGGPQAQAVPTPKAGAGKTPPGPVR